MTNCIEKLVESFGRVCFPLFCKANLKFQPNVEKGRERERREKKTLTIRLPANESSDKVAEFTVG